MKITKKGNRLKPSLLLLAASMLVIVSYLGVASVYGLWPISDKKIENSKVAPAESSTDGSSSKANLEEDDGATVSKEGEESQHVDSTKPSADIPQSSSLSVVIGLLENKNSYVNYAATVKGAKKGTCSALFTSAIGKPVSHVYDTSNGTCEAHIPDVKFDTYGTWKLTLRFYNNNTQAKDEASLTLREE